MPSGKRQKGWPGKRRRPRGQPRPDHLQPAPAPAPALRYRWPVPCRCKGTGVIRDARGNLCVCVHLPEVTL